MNPTADGSIDQLFTTAQPMVVCSVCIDVWIQLMIK